MSFDLPAHDGPNQETWDDIFWVGQGYRTNPLSKTEGGSEVVVVYANGSKYGYDRIKKPSRYIDAISHKIIDLDKDTYDSLTDEEKLSSFKEAINLIYVRRPSQESTASSPLYEEVWNSEIADLLPAALLDAYENSTNNNSSSRPDHSRFYPHTSDEDHTFF